MLLISNNTIQVSRNLGYVISKGTSRLGKVVLHNSYMSLYETYKYQLRVQICRFIVL